MNTTPGVERCLSFINCQLQPPASAKQFGGLSGPKRAVTLSRQSGCGAHAVAEALAAYLQRQAPADAPPWMIFDRNLVERVLEDHQLPARLARFMPEDRVRQIDDVVDELFGLHPPSWTLVQQTSETISRLIEMGNVIILGRGSNVIAANVPYAFHVRLVGSFEARVRRRQHSLGLDAKAAADVIRREDLGRERYFKKHFNRDINDPLLYHLMINTDLIPLDAAARVIGDLVLQQVTVPAWS